MTVFKGDDVNKMGIFSEQTCSRLRKCSFTAFSPVGNYSGIAEASNVKLPAFNKEVIV